MKTHIRRFVQDEYMFDAVKTELFNYFLKPSGTKDTQLLASERLVINMLPQAFKHLQSLVVQEKKQESQGINAV